MTLPITSTALELDEPGIIDALELAFVADPATRWVWPDPQKYLLQFSSFAKAIGGKAFEYKKRPLYWKLFWCSHLASTKHTA